MPVKLDWYDNTVGITSQNIYRSETPIDISSPGEPLTTLPSNVFTYTDNTAVQGKFYYYCIASVKDGQLAVSRVVPIAYLGDLGPGPTTLIRGNWEYGYFGVVMNEDFVLPTDLITAMGSNFAAGVSTSWHKMVVKGVITYFPTQNLFTNTSWQWMYDNGWAYGNLPVQTHVITRFGETPRNKTVTFQSRQYRVRLPTSRKNYMDSTNADMYGGDVDTLLSNVNLYSGGFAPGYYGISDYAVSQAGFPYCTLDFNGNAANSNVVCRGNSGTAAPGGYQVDIVAGVRSPTTQSANWHMRVILELVQ